MPPAVKKGMTVTVLTSIFTFLGITLLSLVGKSSVMAHDTSIDVGYVKKAMFNQGETLKAINVSIQENTTSSYEVRKDLELHGLRISACEKWLDKCDRIHQ